MSLLSIKLGIDLVNGRLHQPRSIRKRRIILIVATVVVAVFVAIALYGFTIDSDPVLLLAAGLMLFSWPYLLSLSPFTQKAANYDIRILKDENGIQGLHVAYKGRDVSVQYTLDKDGKFTFANNTRKTDCVSYADGGKMPQRAKYCIVNYLAYVLEINGLLSEDITVSFE